jgi:phosphohistidine swiveling domain-containing protein
MVETLEAPASLGFRIEGEYFTSLMRDLVREGKWRKAYGILMDGLEGMGADAVLDILRGAKKLVGVNDLDLADDDAAPTVQAWLDYQLGTCFSFRGRLYRAYGYVGGFQQKDYTLAQQIFRGEDEQMQQNRMWRKADAELSEQPRLKSFNPWKENYETVLQHRPAYYARNRSTDICIMVNLSPGEFRPVMCEEVDADVPLWYIVPTKAADVIREAHARHALPDLFDGTMEPPAPVCRTTPVADDARRAKEAALVAQAQQEQEAQAARIARMRADIVAFADADAEYGWLELSAYDEKAGRNVQLRVPHRAFICAALDRAKAQQLMPDYAPRCPSGLKLMNDDPYHSDAWIGAGMEIRDAYDREVPEQRLFLDKLYELQRQRLGFAFDVLARGKDDYVFGEVIHDPQLAGEDKILVLKTAAPEHAPAALRCKAVIVESGSKLAHLVVVSREEAIPVIRAEAALERFLPEQHVSIDFAAGKVSLQAG